MDLICCCFVCVCVCECVLFASTESEIEMGNESESVERWALDICMYVWRQRGERRCRWKIRSTTQWQSGNYWQKRNVAIDREQRYPSARTHNTPIQMQSTSNSVAAIGVWYAVTAVMAFVCVCVCVMWLCTVRHTKYYTKYGRHFDCGALFTALWLSQHSFSLSVVRRCMTRCYIFTLIKYDSMHFDAAAFVRWRMYNSLFN